MDEWFGAIQSSCELSPEAARKLHDTGFLVLAGPVATTKLSQLAAAYDAAMSSADPADIAIGGTTTRVHDFVNRGSDFDSLYIHAPILAACCSVIKRPFKLSTMLARTLHPGSPAQGLHVDFPREMEGWPMVGFILMVDEFREENGATCFVPGSHLWPQAPGDLIQGQTSDYEGQVAACGPAGSVVIYNGSVWHGHGANRTDQPRRSLQGAYISRDAKSWIDLPARMRPETLDRITPLARYLLAL
jgi:hypothetical protein